ncbi:MAG: ISL3 family transposase [Actinobacteria bacterium]|nr:ISL3 family transposase [Actinomycetota bacterium]
MRDIELFQSALGLADPWRVVASSFDADQRRLELRIDFERGARFACPECDQEGCAVHDTAEKRWRHLDFFEHQAYLVARVPRVVCPEHGVRQVALAWARPGSGFTLLFEALVMTLVAEMPVAAVGELVGEHDTRIWRLVHHHVDCALAAQDLSRVKRVAVDETSFRRGQDYVSVFACLDQARVVFATPGRDAGAYERFAGDLAAHGGAAGQVTEVCQDMSESYLTGALEHLPEAEITFDRYHIKAQLTKAVDEVRRAERAEHAVLLRHTRYLWLRNPRNLTDNQAERLKRLLRLPLATGRAYRWMLRFDGVYEIADPDQAAAYLRRFTRGARHSRLQPIIDFARMVDEYWLGIVRWWHSRISNGLLEGLHSLVQAAKRRARGYRSIRNYLAMIHLTAGKLDVAVTHTKQR